MEAELLPPFSAFPLTEAANCLFLNAVLSFILSNLSSLGYHGIISMELLNKTH